MSREGNIVRELRQAGFTVLTRRQWGSRHRATYQTRRTTRRFVGAADHLFAHITVTHDTGNARADMRTVEDIGWSRFRTGASYNWCLHRSTKTVLLGMPHDAAGAHTINDKGISGFPSNLNYWGHAIAFIGVPGDPFTDWCVRAAAAIEAAEKKHGACKDGARWYPHSKFAAKDCPCDPYRNSLDDIAHTARTVLRPTTPPITPVPEEDDDMPTPEEFWKEPIPLIGEEGHRAAQTQLGQAYYTSKQGRAFAKAAHEQTKRNRKAIEQMANSLPDEVRDAVLSALGEEINVDLSVEE